MRMRDNTRAQFEQFLHESRCGSNTAVGVPVNHRLQFLRCVRMKTDLQLAHSLRRWRMRVFIGRPADALNRAGVQIRYLSFRLLSAKRLPHLHLYPSRYSLIANQRAPRVLQLEAPTPLLKLRLRLSPCVNCSWFDRSARTGDNEKKWRPARYAYHRRGIFRLERAATYKSEFADGEIFAMPGRNSLALPIAANWIAHLGYKLRGGTYDVLSFRYASANDSLRSYVYADVSVACGASVMNEDDDDILLNPKVVIEVLSPSTADYDRGKNLSSIAKFRRFRNMSLPIAIHRISSISPGKRIQFDLSRV